MKTVSLGPISECHTVNDDTSVYRGRHRYTVDDGICLCTVGDVTCLHTVRAVICLHRVGEITCLHSGQWSMSIHIRQ